jgi:thymidylate synthase (FAD)
VNFEIVKPSAELIGMTVNAHIDEHGVLIPGTSCEGLIEDAGRTCYRSEGRKTQDSYKGFIERIMKRGHLSVVEHASATIVFVTDRGVTHELVRHRLASFSQESTRYVKYNNGPIKIIEPPGLNDAQYLLWADGIDHACRRYGDLLAAGCKPEIARSVLPNALATKITVSANLREWLHILDLRTSEYAHPQIREIMFMAEQLLLKVAPTIIGARNDR